jgi:glycine betaine/proline transport system ATP-binding protein
VLAQFGGEMHRRFRVTREGRQVGVLEMEDLVRALVPSRAAEHGMRTRASA